MRAKEFLTEAAGSKQPNAELSVLFGQFYAEPNPANRKEILKIAKAKTSSEYGVGDWRDWDIWRNAFLTKNDIEWEWDEMTDVGYGTLYNMKIALGKDYNRVLQKMQASKTKAKAERLAYTKAEADFTRRDSGKQARLNDPLKPLYQALLNWYEGQGNKTDVNLILNHPMAKKYGRVGGKGYVTLYRAIPVTPGFIAQGHDVSPRVYKPITKKARYPIVAYSSDIELAIKAAEDYDPNGEIIVFAKKIKASDILLNFDNLVGRLEGFEEPSNGLDRAEEEYWVRADPEYLTFRPNEQVIPKKRKDS